MRIKYSLSKFVACNESSAYKKYIVLNEYIRREERYEIVNLNFHLKITRKIKLNPKEAEEKK